MRPTQLPTITPVEAAEIIGVSLSTVMNRIHSGRLTVVKFGSRYGTSVEWLAKSITPAESSADVLEKNTIRIASDASAVQRKRRLDKIRTQLVIGKTTMSCSGS